MYLICSHSSTNPFCTSLPSSESVSYFGVFQILTIISEYRSSWKSNVIPLTVLKSPWFEVISSSKCIFPKYLLDIVHSLGTEYT